MNNDFFIKLVHWYVLSDTFFGPQFPVESLLTLYINSFFCLWLYLFIYKHYLSWYAEFYKNHPLCGPFFRFCIFLSTPSTLATPFLLVIFSFFIVITLIVALCLTPLTPEWYHIDYYWSYHYTAAFRLCKIVGLLQYFTYILLATYSCNWDKPTRAPTFIIGVQICSLMVLRYLSLFISLDICLDD